VTLPITEITWEDSRSVAPKWHSAKGFPDEELMLLHSVGYIASEDEHRIILVSSFDPHVNKFQGGIIVPLSAVRKRKDWRKA
jgi:hypothetical protein